MNEIVSLKDIVVDFDGERILDELSLDIHDKEFVTFLGPSGCGKTTTLRVIAGFITPKSGNVFFDGKDIASVPPYKRQVNTVFQKYALFPHLNVYENVAFGLRLKKLPEETIRPKVSRGLKPRSTQANSCPPKLTRKSFSIMPSTMLESPMNLATKALRGSL